MQLVDNGMVTDGWRPWPLHASPTVARVRYWRAADQGVEQCRALRDCSPCKIERNHRVLTLDLHPPRRSLLLPTSLRRSTLRSYRRAIECRDGVPFDRFARQWLLRHTPIGDAAQQAWTSLWGKLFTDEETDAPGPQLELELSLRAAWDQERQRLEVAKRSQRTCEASEEKKYRLRELHLANGKRRRRLLKRGVKVGPPRKHFWGSCGKDRMDFLEERSREYARRRKARRMAERQTRRRARH